MILIRDYLQQAMAVLPYDDHSRMIELEEMLEGAIALTRTLETPRRQANSNNVIEFRIAAARLRPAVG
jgi:hypothetical protein